MTITSKKMEYVNILLIFLIILFYSLNKKKSETIEFILLILRNIFYFVVEFHV